MKEVNIISTVVQRDQSGKRVPTGNTILIQGDNVNVEDLKNELSKEFISKKKEDIAEKIIEFKEGLSINGLKVESIVLSEDNTVPNDNSVPTTKHVDERYLRKDKDDRSKGTVASDKGFEVGKFQEGTFGSGASTFMRDGNSYSEVDFLKVRKKATFTNITVQELKHVGGEIILSPAAMVCSRVEVVEEGYKCYFSQTDYDGRKVYNEFEVGDQARCQTFNLENNTYYWRLVTEVGDDYIVLSASDSDSGSGIPKVGDNISQLGNRNDSDRQAAIILSAYGSDAPSYKQYNGINSYSLEGKQVTKLSPYGNELTGIVNIESGSTGASNLEDFPDEVYKAVHIGAVNLLLNSGFTGDYKTEDLNDGYPLNSESELYSKSLKYWEGIASVADDDESVSGRSVEIGSLSQSVTLIKGENYVISFKAKGSEIAVSCGDFSVAQSLSSDYQRYSYKFVSNGIGDILFSGTAKVCDIQLERGTIATDWNPSPYDNDKTLAEFQAIKYLRDAIMEGDTSILGGLILSTIIKLGNFKDGVMHKVNAGISGIYNSDDDVAIWAGGSFEQAIRTVMKLKYDKKNPPTDEEWEELANFVTTHGGDLFLRGYIDALGGRFRGKVETSIAGKRIVIDPANQSMTMYNEIGLETLILSFRDGGENWTWGDLQLRRYNYDAASSSYAIAFESRMTASNVDIYNRIDNTWTRITTDGCQITAATDERHYNIITSLVRKYDDNGALQYRCNVLSDCWETDAAKVGAGAVYAEPQYDDDGTLISKTLKVKV